MAFGWDSWASIEHQWVELSFLGFGPSVFKVKLGWTSFHKSPGSFSVWLGNEKANKTEAKRNGKKEKDGNPKKNKTNKRNDETRHKMAPEMERRAAWLERRFNAPTTPASVAMEAGHVGSSFSVVLRPYWPVAAKKKKEMKRNKRWQQQTFDTGAYYALFFLFFFRGPFAGSYWVFTEFWSGWTGLVLPGFTGCYQVLLGFTGFYWVLLGFYWVLLGFTGFYWVLMGLTGCVPSYFAKA